MSGNSDIKLIHGAVVIDAWDLQLDSPDRRKNETPYRRALVHDFADGLTVNWGNDYPGGVSLNCVTVINGGPHKGLNYPGHLPEPGQRLEVNATNLLLNGTAVHLNKDGANGLQHRAMLHDDDDGLIINPSGDYKGGVTINGHVTLADRVTTPHLQVEGTTHLRLGTNDRVLIELTGVRIPLPGTPIDETIDLVAEIRSLRSQIAALQTKVATLEQNNT